MEVIDFVLLAPAAWVAFECAASLCFDAYDWVIQHG